MTFSASADLYENTILLSYEGYLHEESIYDYFDEQVEIFANYSSGASDTPAFYIDYIASYEGDSSSDEPPLTEIKLFVEDSWQDDLYFSDATSIQIQYTEPGETSDERPTFAEVSDPCAPEFISSFTTDAQIEQSSGVAEFRIEYIELYYAPITYEDSEYTYYDYDNQAFIAWFNDQYDTNALGDNFSPTLLNIYATLPDGSVYPLNESISDSGPVENGYGFYMDIDDSALQSLESAYGSNVDYDPIASIVF